MDKVQLEDLYGPLYPYSDFKLGDTITYRQKSETLTGKIIWICYPENVAGREIAVCYIVECDSQNGIPHTVFLSDVVM